MPTFKNSMNVYLTKGLFYEFCAETGNYDYAIYTIQEEDRFVEGKRFQSAYRLFLETDDPTGYTFSNLYLGSWYHYEQLMKAPWFRTIIDKATKELEIKTKSKALLSIVREANDRNSKSSFQASRYLLEKGWVEKNENKQVGRPSKEAILAEANKMFIEKNEVEDDFLRLLPPESVN